MDFSGELERMAGVAVAGDKEACFEIIEAWQKLFSYSFAEASDQLAAHRRDLNRAPITDEHWNAVRFNMERQGYDRGKQVPS